MVNVFFFKTSNFQSPAGDSQLVVDPAYFVDNVDLVVDEATGRRNGTISIIKP